MKLKLNKKQIIIGIIILLIGLIYLGVDYCLYSPSPINRYIATNIYKTPANSAFTDDNFYQCVIDKYNLKNKTNIAYTTSLSDEQLKSINSLKCEKENISSVNGLEKLTNITSLQLTSNYITEINLSENNKLKYLYLENNQLTEMDISKNINLIKIIAYGNNIEKIDVSDNINLEDLHLANNKIPEIDVSNNVNLKRLILGGDNCSFFEGGAYSSCPGNLLTKLDISKNVLLEELGVSNNNLTSLDISNNSLLKSLWASNNQITEIDFSNNSLLEFISVSNNSLFKIDVTMLPSLVSLEASEIQITELDISENMLLRNLETSNNQLTELDVSNNSNLTHLYAESNQLTELDVSNNQNLEYLYIEKNNLTSLDVSNHLLLRYLNVSYNQLTELILNNNSSLDGLRASNNQITEIDISSATSLTQFSIDNNQLTELDASKNDNLYNLSVIGNNFYKKIKPMLVGEKINLNDYKAVKLSKRLLNEIESVIENYSDNLEQGDGGFIPTEVGKATYKINNLEIKYNMLKAYEEIIEFEVVDVKSDIYKIDITKDYIDIGNDSFDEVLNNIEVINGEAILDGNDLVIKNGGEEAKRFYLIGIKSSVYEINNDYIYVGNDYDDEIINNIETNANIDVMDNDNLYIWFDDYEKKYKLIRIDTNDYIGEDFIFTLNSDVLENINIINGDKSLIDNKVIISYEDKILDELEVFTITSDIYNIGNKYIYTLFDELKYNNIKYDGLKVNAFNNLLTVKKDGIIIDEVPIYYLNINNYNVRYSDNIYIKGDMTYEQFYNSFVSNIDGISIQVYDGNNNIITSGNVTNGYKIKVLINDVIVGEYNIELMDDCIDYHTTADLLYTDNYNEDILKYSKPGDTFDEVKSLFSVDSDVSFLDKDNQIMLGTDITKTGDRFKFITNHEHIIYLSLMGDVNGTGKINIDDVNKSYEILRDRVDVEKYYEVAGDIDGDGKIKINDVAKLYAYVKKKISGLGEVSKEDKIHFIAVGGSDAFLIESNGFYGLVDSSNPNDDSNYGTQDYNKNVSKVIDYLKKVGVEKLDFILATHSHSDHIGGMPMIAEAGFVDENTQYYYRTYLGTEEDISVPDWDNRGYYEKAVNAMISKGAQMNEITNREPTIKLGDFSIKLVNTDGVANEVQENFNAIGALVTKGNTKVFLASDIEIVDAGKVADAIGDVDVLKLNHHGHSGYDGNYLAKLNPENVIVTNNKFEDHFKPYASDLTNRGIKVYMTGTSVDAIRLTVDDNGYSIEKNINPLSYKMEGWQRLYNNHFYFNPQGIMARGWHELNWSGGTDWFYFDNNGVMLTGFQELVWGDNKEYKNWFYFEPTNGNMLTGWQRIDISWYYFNPQGIMLTGWIEDKGNLYYLNKDGVMLIDWQQIDGNWYYFGTDGIRVHDWQKIGDSWYYFNSDGIMLTGWQEIRGKWYYFNEKGVMLLGWQQLSWNGVTSWYYFDLNDGSMINGTCKVIDGTTYCFDGSGVCTSNGC